MEIAKDGAGDRDTVALQAVGLDVAAKIALHKSSFGDTPPLLGGGGYKLNGCNYLAKAGSLNICIQMGYR